MSVANNDGLQTNPYRTVVKEFEESVAYYAGSKYAVAVDTCSSAIFLSLKYRLNNGYSSLSSVPVMPSRTYCSVPNQLIHCGFNQIMFTDLIWSGSYEIQPLNIIDAALQFKRGMYQPDSLTCLSFQYRKHIPIGRGGMILTDDRYAYDWLKLARFNGRPERPLNDSDAEPRFPGWLMHMEPERAARGLHFMMHVKDSYPDLVVDYPELHKMKAYQKYSYGR